MVWFVAQLAQTVKVFATTQQIYLMKQITSLMTTAHV